MSTAQDQKITIISSDHQRFTVDRKVAEKSVLIKNMLKNIISENNESDSENEDGTSIDDIEIPTQNVRSVVLEKVINWCEHYKNVDFPDEESEEDSKKSSAINSWDKEYFNIDQEMMYEIILAANYLNIKPLLNTGCKVVAELIRGKSPEEIRTTFNIQNDFTPEEEAAIRRENEWAEDR